MHRAVGPLLLVVVVALAGCSGVFGGSGEPTATVTPAAVPTDQPTPTPVPQLAPGLTGAGIEDPDALLAAHESVLETRSFTTHTNATEVAQNGSVVSRATSTVHAGPPGEGTFVTVERDGNEEGPSGAISPAHTEWWLDDGTLLANQTYTNGTTTYDRASVSAADGRRVGIYGSGGFRYLFETFGTDDTSVVERERNGTTLYLVRGNARTEVRGDVRLRLLVDDRGVIHRYRVVRDSSYDGTTTEVTYSGIGTTDQPERPSWVEAALNRTTPPNPGISPSNTATGTTTTPSRTANRTATANRTTTEPSS